MTPLQIETTRGRVELATSGDGPAVLALHGAMGGADNALLLARALAPDAHRVIAPSRPGYLGTSLALARTPEQQADLYAATLDALGVERAAVIAASGGGPSALSFAMRHRDRCARLVIVSSLGGPMRGRMSASFHLRMWLGRRAWFSRWLAAKIARDPEAAARRAIRDPEVRARTLADPESGPLLRELLANVGHDLARRIDGTRNDIAQARRFDLPLEAIDLPTLVMHGTRDPVVPFDEHGATLARRIPRAELLAIDGGEHMIVFTHRATLRERVTRFLRE